MELHRPSGRASLGFAFAFLTMAAWGVLPLALELVLQSLDTATITLSPTTGTGAVQDAEEKLEADHLAVARLGGTSNAGPPGN